MLDAGARTYKVRVGGWGKGVDGEGGFLLFCIQLIIIIVKSIYYFKRKKFRLVSY